MALIKMVFNTIQQRIQIIEFLYGNERFVKNVYKILRNVHSSV